MNELQTSDRPSATFVEWWPAFRLDRDTLLGWLQRLLPQGMRKLCAKAPRHRRIIGAIVHRRLVLGHVERAEQDVPDRECGGEVGVAAFLQAGVMPAMEHRRRDHVFERAKSPIQVRM